MLAKAERERPARQHANRALLLSLGSARMQHLRCALANDTHGTHPSNLVYICLFMPAALHLAYAVGTRLHSITQPCAHHRRKRHPGDVVQARLQVTCLPIVSRTQLAQAAAQRLRRAQHHTWCAGLPASYVACIVFLTACSRSLSSSVSFAALLLPIIHWMHAAILAAQAPKLLLMARIADSTGWLLVRCSAPCCGAALALGGAPCS